MLNIGDTLFLDLKFSEERERYKCKIVEKKDNQLYIDYPINEKTKKTGFFMEGTQFKASFYAKDSAIYMFDTEVLGRKKMNIPMVIIDYPGKEKLVRIQRREYVRVDTGVDVAVHPINGEFNPFVTLTADISAGGAALILPGNHRIHAEMETFCWFVLPLENGEYFYEKVRCKIIRIIHGKNSERDKAPIQFIDITENQRQSFIKFAFDYQLSMRKRGLD